VSHLRAATRPCADGRHRLSLHWKVYKYLYASQLEFKSAHDPRSRKENGMETCLVKARSRETEHNEDEVEDVFKLHYSRNKEANTCKRSLS
jgi:hypothetical protein